MGRWTIFNCLVLLAVIVVAVRTERRARDLHTIAFAKSEAMVALCQDLNVRVATLEGDGRVEPPKPRTATVNPHELYRRRLETPWEAE